MFVGSRKPRSRGGMFAEEAAARLGQRNEGAANFGSDNLAPIPGGHSAPVQVDGIAFQDVKGKTNTVVLPKLHKHESEPQRRAAKVDGQWTPSPPWSSIKDMRAEPLRNLRKTRQNDVSYLSDRGMRVGGSQTFRGGIVDYHLPAAEASMQRQPASAREDKAWASQFFHSLNVSGRQDVINLRSKLMEDLNELSVRANDDMMELSEAAVRVYDRTLYELARQVSTHCVERGRLMTDVWHSHVHLYGRILSQLKAENTELKDTVEQLGKDKRALEREVKRLLGGAELIKAEGEIAELKDKLKDSRLRLVGR